MTQHTENEHGTIDALNGQIAAQARESGESTRATDQKITKQLIVVIILCFLPLLLFRLGAVPLVLTGVFAFLDAWYAGIRKKPGVTSFFNISPAGWAASILLLFIAGFPLYLIKRNSLKTSDGNLLLFVFTLVFGVVTVAAVALGVLVLLAGAVQGA